MKRSVEAIRDNLNKFSVNELRELKTIIIDELSKRDQQGENSILKGRFYAILNGIYNRYGEIYSYEEMILLLSEETEDEFYKWHKVGKTTISFAKQELQKQGLSFKRTQ